ncbi:MAG: hypothetical protein WDA27_01475 [Actinomycetota bacterium]
MIVASAILLLVAVVTLVIGIFGNGLQMITVSIVSSVLAGIALTVGLLQGRKKVVPSVAGIPVGTDGVPEEPQMREASLFRGSASPVRGSDAPSAPLAPLEIGGRPTGATSLERLVTPASAGRPLEIGTSSGARSAAGGALKIPAAKPKATRTPATRATGSSKAVAAKPIAKPRAVAAKPASKPKAAAKTAPKAAAKTVAPAAEKTPKTAAPKATKAPAKPKAPTRKPAAKKTPPPDDLG